ncbi:MAG: nucleoside recognition domain-containing protein [Gemmiger sp.]
MNQGLIQGTAALLLGAAVLVRPEAAALGFGEGLRLCAGSLLPALFPFFVVCELLSASSLCRWLGAPLRPLTKRLGLGAQESGSALLLSWLGGYAVCARLAAGLRERGILSRREATLLLVLGCCSGPGFVVGCVGGQLLGSVSLGVFLYLLQILSNLLVTVLLALIWRGDRESFACGRTAAVHENITLPQAIGRAVDSSMTVCGCVVFFRILYRLAESLLSSQGSGALLSFLSGFLEISAGCADFAQQGSLTGICFCLSILSLSVFAQLAALLDGCVSLKILGISRILHLAVMQVLFRLSVRLVPGSMAVFSSLAPRVIVIRREQPDTVLAIFFFLCAALFQLYKLCRSFYNKDKSLSVQSMKLMKNRAGLPGFRGRNL